MTDIKFIGTNQVELVNSLSENKISPVQSGESFIEFSFDSALSKDSSDYFHFEISGQNVQVSGRITEVHNDYQFFKLFAGCEQITDASELILSAPTMKKFCYANMFLDCTNLTTPPQIQASTLDQWCYSSMFGNCYSLTAVPVLSATTLADYCYFGMFYNCKALSSAPNLPAQTLEDWCYNSMFYNCQNLTSISADFTSWTPSTATTNWVTGIDTEGQFYNDNVAYIYGVDNVPENWQPDYEGKYLEFYSNANSFNWWITLSTSLGNSQKKFKYKLDQQDFWRDYTLGEQIHPSSISGRVQFSGDATSLNGNYNFAITKSGSDDINVKGQVNSLIDFNDEMADNEYAGLIQRTPITDASNLILPSTNLSYGCYRGMFWRCYYLTTAPELPATTLADYCYTNMFGECTSLTDAPVLPALETKSECYRYMFERCTSLTAAPPILPATKLSYRCYAQMFHECTALTAAPEIAVGNDFNYQGTLEQMFDGCNHLERINVNFTKWGNIWDGTYNWVYNVALTGTFTKPSDLPEQFDASHIPQGWNVVNK